MAPLRMPLKMWDVEGGYEIATFTCDGTVDCCAFVNPTEFAAGDAAGACTFWN